MRTRIIPLTALLVAACGGGGSDDTAVSANPSPPPVAATPQPAPAPPPRVDAPAPIQTPAPTPKPPAPAPGPAPQPPAAPQPSPTPAPEPAPIVRTVEAYQFDSAIRRGIPLAEELPPQAGGSAPAYWHDVYERRLHPTAGASMRIFSTTQLTDGRTHYAVGFPWQNEYNIPSLIRNQFVFGQRSGMSMTITRANGIDFPPNYVAWTQTVVLDQTLGEWRNGDWFVRLIPQSEPGRDDLFRVCWLVYLPDMGKRTGDFNEEWLIPPGPPISRLTCSTHRKHDGVDVGGFAVDDVAGKRTEYRGAW